MCTVGYILTRIHMHTIAGRVRRQTTASQESRADRKSQARREHRVCAAQRSKSAAGTREGTDMLVYLCIYIFQLSVYALLSEIKALQAHVRGLT